MSLHCVDLHWAGEMADHLFNCPLRPVECPEECGVQEVFWFTYELIAEWSGVLASLMRLGSSFMLRTHIHVSHAVLTYTHSVRNVVAGRVM